MKMLIAATLLILGSTANAEPLPNGIFKGTGIWKSVAQKGGYAVNTEIEDGRIRSTYIHAGGDTKEWDMQLIPGNNGFFKIKTGDAIVGDGYCLDHVMLCHYSLSELDFEETLALQNGKLYKYGSKTVNGSKIVWQETLEN